MTTAPIITALPGFEGVSAPGTVYRAADYYGTPRWATEAVLPHVLRRVPPRPGQGWLLEAGIGHGAIAEVMADAGYHVRGLDLRPEAVAECQRRGIERLRAGRAGSIETAQADFETWAGPAEQHWGAPLIGSVGNPPFWSDGPRLLKWLEQLVFLAGNVFVLLPARFMHTREKAAFHRTYRADLLQLDERPAFDAAGGKDECIWWMYPSVGPRGQIWREGDDA